MWQETDVPVGRLIQWNKLERCYQYKLRQAVHSRPMRSQWHCCTGTCKCWLNAVGARFRRLRVEYDSDDTFHVDSQRFLSLSGSEGLELTWSKEHGQ